ncbi:MAG: ABC transporter permease, partial [Nocardioides sp.]
MTGTGVLLRTFLRRDRWLLLWWALGGTLLYWSQAVSVKGLYSTQAEFDRAATMMESNPALIAMAGPARALDTVGGQVTWQSAAFGAIVVGLMSMFIVGRHTRAEEESGRDELIRAGVVGRRAPMTAALAAAAIANLLVGGLIAVSLVSVPLAVPDSVALGVGVTLCGFVFTGVALVAAQLTASTRTMYGLTGLVIAASYALRAVGDVGNEALSWMSPIGWYQQMYAFSGLRWWPALLLAAAALVTVLVAYAVFERRDIGAGVFAARPGPARAHPSLGSSWGLAWRLQRGSVIGWALGLLATGLSYGSIGNDAGDLMGDSEAARDMMVAAGGDLVDGFFAMAMTMLALL